MRSRATTCLLLFLLLLLTRALRGRLIDLPLALPLCKVLVGWPLALADVGEVDPPLGHSLATLESLARDADRASRARDTRALAELRARCDALCLQFTLPGDDAYALAPRRADEPVTLANLPE